MQTHSIGACVDWPIKYSNPVRINVVQWFFIFFSSQCEFKCKFDRENCEGKKNSIMKGEHSRHHTIWVMVMKWLLRRPFCTPTESPVCLCLCLTSGCLKWNLISRNRKCMSINSNLFCQTYSETLFAYSCRNASVGLFLDLSEYSDLFRQMVWSPYLTHQISIDTATSLSRRGVWMLLCIIQQALDCFYRDNFLSEDIVQSQQWLWWKKSPI